jgi:hypothetical protein
VNAGAFSFIRGMGLPIARFARNRGRGGRGYTNFISLLVWAVHFLLQFLQELGALLGG